jgi:hypothetical protein
MNPKCYLNTLLKNELFAHLLQGKFCCTTGLTTPSESVGLRIVAKKIIASNG